MWRSESLAVGRQHCDMDKNWQLPQAELHLIPIEMGGFHLCLRFAFLWCCTLQSICSMEDVKRVCWCGEKSLLGEQGKIGCFEGCFFFAQRLYIWSNRTTYKIKIITNHNNLNNFLLPASWDYPVFFPVLIHFGVMHLAYISDIIFFFILFLFFFLLIFITWKNA